MNECTIANANAAFASLAGAYATLSDPVLREKYDLHLRYTEQIDRGQIERKGDSAVSALNSFETLNSSLSFALKMFGSVADSVSTGVGASALSVTSQTSAIVSSEAAAMGMAQTGMAQATVLGADMADDVLIASQGIASNEMSALAQARFAVGAATFVGGTLSLLVGAWQAKNEAQRRQWQADVVSGMSDEHLDLLLEDIKENDDTNSKIGESNAESTPVRIVNTFARNLSENVASVTNAGKEWVSSKNVAAAVDWSEKYRKTKYRAWRSWWSRSSSKDNLNDTKIIDDEFSHLLQKSSLDTETNKNVAECKDNLKDNMDKESTPSLDVVSPIIEKVAVESAVKTMKSHVLVRRALSWSPSSSKNKVILEKNSKVQKKQKLSTSSNSDTSRLISTVNDRILHAAARSANRTNVSPRRHSAMAIMCSNSTETHHNSNGKDLECKDNNILLNDDATEPSTALDISVSDTSLDPVSVILKHHNLTKKQISRTAAINTLKKGSEGVADAGSKALGGVALTRLTTRFAPSTVAKGTMAPFAAAAILVEAGKEFLLFKKEVAEQGDKRGVALTKSEEKLLRSQMRLRIGRHFAANAGAGAGTVMATTAIATGGAIGVAAATGCALAAGMISYFFALSSYDHCTESIAKEYQNEKVIREQLWQGAKLLFESVDSEYISIDECADIIARLYGSVKPEDGKDQDVDGTNCLIRAQAIATSLAKKTSKRLEDEILSGDETPINVVLNSARNRKTKEPVVAWKEFWDWCSSLSTETSAKFVTENEKKNRTKNNELAMISKRLEVPGTTEYAIKPGTEKEIEEVAVLCSLLSEKALRNYVIEEFNVDKSEAATDRTGLQLIALKATAQNTLLEKKQFENDDIIMD